MSTIINYNDQRKPTGDKYFLQYPNGNNIAALWKMFWNVRIEHDENIRSFEFRLFNSLELSETTLNMAIMQLPLLFSNYTTQFLGGTPKKVILKPKEDIKFLDNTDWLTDKRTTKLVTQKEYELLRGSIWFIS